MPQGLQALSSSLLPNSLDELNLMWDIVELTVQTIA